MPRSLAERLEVARRVAEGRACFAKYNAMFCRYPMVRRVLAGFVIRPWLIDIGCGVAAMQWGLWVGLHNESVAMSRSFVRFNPVLRELACLVFLAGALQFWFALLKMPRSRQGIALIKVTLWVGIASGISIASGQAAYAGYALLDMLILVRAY